MQKESVYLDHAATTPLEARVLEVMLPLLGGEPSNPSSIHSPGQRARAVVEEARGHVAALIGARPSEVYFTSGATESDALAISGLARAAGPERRHAVISAVEHAAVREAARSLERDGWGITRLGVDAAGMVDPEEVTRALRKETAFVAVMWANNEVGTLQPVEEISRLCAEQGIPFHTDAVQAAGRLPIDAGAVPFSTLALSSHKLYGPQGVGALFVRDGAAVEPLMAGGGQEGGLRGGTHNVAAIAGFGEAARLAGEELHPRREHEERLRDLILGAVEEMEGVRLSGHPRLRLPNNLHLTVEGVESEGLVLFCDALGYAISSGSACASSDAGHRVSAVLGAMGFAEREALSAVRVTVGKDTTREEARGFTAAFATAVERLRSLSPVGGVN